MLACAESSGCAHSGTKSIPHSRYSCNRTDKAMALFTMQEVVDQFTGDSQEFLSLRVMFLPGNTRVLMRMLGCDQSLPHQEECWSTTVRMQQGLSAKLPSCIITGAYLCTSELPFQLHRDGKVSCQSALAAENSYFSWAVS